MTNTKGILENILFLLCLFPYLSPVATPFDTQPYGLLFGFLILIIKFVQNKGLKIPKKLIPYFLIFFFAFVIMLMRSNIIDGIRSLVGYASVAILSLAGYYSFKFVKGKCLLFAVNVWFVFALIQTLINKSFGSFMISRMSTSADRGVTSLAVEPSSYAIMCIFFFVLNDIFFARGDYSKKTYNYIFIITIIQLLLSKAAMGFVLLAIYLVVKVFTTGNILKKLKNLTGFIVIGGIFYYLFTTVQSLREGRVGTLLTKLEGGITDLILKDGSIADRLSHILVSFSSLFHSYGLGYGLATWDEHALEIANNSGEFISEVSSVNFTPGRIMSGWGTAVFELGIVGIVFMVMFFIIMRSGIKHTKGYMRDVYKSTLITIFFTMLMSVPLSFPLFGYLIGAMIQLQHEDVAVRERENLKKRRKFKKYRLVW